MTPSSSASPDSSTDPSTWIDRHGDIMYRFAIARVGDKTIAEDLVQEALLAAIQGLGSFARTSSERSWLIGILRHKLLDHFRCRARDRRVWEEPSETPDENAAFDRNGHWAVAVPSWGSPEDALEQEEFWRTFESCVDALPRNLKTSYALREFDGLDSDELADVLGVSKNNVWVMLSRARRRLRECLQNHWFAA